MRYLLLVIFIVFSTKLYAFEVPQVLKEKLPESYLRLVDQVNFKIKKLKKTNHKIVAGRFNSWNNTIAIHPDILEDQKLLTHTLIHELSHAYETNIEKISNDRTYQLLAGYHRSGFPFVRTQRHQFAQNSPDEYEYKNINESFPVNMEYFLLDPEYQCRRPLLYEFIANKLNHFPFQAQKCEYDSLLPVSNGELKEWENVDLNKLYQVHFLFASKGKAIMSRWGHAMIRLVICAPERTHVNEECLKDINNHLVLSFRANVRDITLNYLKGLFGKYPSQAFLIPMVDIIREYNKVELRDLHSLNMNLNDVQMNRFKLHVQEVTKAYEGRYRFLSVNCATEALNFFQTIFQDEELTHMNVISPIGMYRKLLSTQLIDPNPILIKSHREKYENAFNKIGHLVKSKNLNHYLNKTNISQREAIVTINFDKSQLSSLILLEKLILDKKENKLMEKIAKKVQKLRKRKTTDEEVSILESWRETMVSGNNVIKLPGVYGLPLKGEFNPTKISPLNQETQEQIQLWVKENFSSEFDDIKNIKVLINKKLEELKVLIGE